MRTLNEIREDIFYKNYQRVVGKIYSEIYKGIRNNESEIIIQDFYNNDRQIIRKILSELRSAGYVITESTRTPCGLFISLID